MHQLMLPRLVVCAGGCALGAECSYHYCCVCYRETTTTVVAVWRNVERGVAQRSVV